MAGAAGSSSSGQHLSLSLERHGVCESQSNRTSHHAVCHNMSEIGICCSWYSGLHPGSFEQSRKEKQGGQVQKLRVKRVKFTQEKGKEHLQITRGVASSILPVFAVALWKPQRLSIAFFFP